MAGGNSDGFSLQQVLEEESRQKKKLEEEVRVLRSQLAHVSLEANHVCFYCIFKCIEVFSVYHVSIQSINRFFDLV